MYELIMTFLVIASIIAIGAIGLVVYDIIISKKQEEEAEEEEIQEEQKIQEDNN